jgi:hypothetical protein
MRYLIPLFPNIVLPKPDPEASANP